MKSLSILNYILQNCFKYISDEALFGIKEFWQLPEQFYKNKRGDCEDYAIYAHEITKTFLPISEVLAVFNKNNGHAVNYFEIGTTRGHIGNWGLFKSDQWPTIFSICNNIFNDWTVCGYARRTKNGKFELYEYWIRHGDRTRKFSVPIRNFNKRKLI